MTRRARAHIDLGALRHNFAVVRERAGDARVMAVVKADAYGHGMLNVAQALQAADGFAVATVGEGLRLREAGCLQPILVLQGAHTTEELIAAARARLWPVVHQAQQVDWVERLGRACNIECWLKLDTGMGRLGFAADEGRAALARLGAACRGVLSHFANADVPDDPRNHAQYERFQSLTSRLGLERSMANSAGLLAFEAARFDWVRPGLMLYGASPLAGVGARALGLRPVMSLKTTLLAVQHHQRGDCIGYGGTWCCPEAMPVGIAAVGYADGYPRHARTGTPVAVAGVRCGLLGRVSMDMVAIDLRGCPTARPGDEVVMWGGVVTVDEVAAGADTLAYELLCAAGRACAREYHGH